MKKILITVSVILITISCKPSVITDAKIDARYTYTSDQTAIAGILKDIYEIDQELLKKHELPEIAEWIKSLFFEEEKEMSEWLKRKFGSEIRKGEMIKIKYTYKNDHEGIDAIYRPYNKDTFSSNLVSIYDLASVLDGIENPPAPSNNNSTNSNNKTTTPTPNTNTQQNTPTSGNRIANSEWHGDSVWGKKCQITFGTTSYILNVDGDVITSTYTITGDTVSLNFGTMSTGRPIDITGSLIGNTLTFGSDWDFSGQYRRVR